MAKKGLSISEFAPCAYERKDPVTGEKKIFLRRKNPKQEQEIQTIQQPYITENSIPDNLFENIIGHNQLKWLLNRVIKSQTPCHILLYGKPATAKTLFLSELSRLPNSKFLLGSSTSKAGLTDYLLEYQPTYLILDEIDKVKKEDLSVLLSLMEGGIVSKLKKRVNKTVRLRTWVFGSGNKIDYLPSELKSRFWIYYVKPYGREEFKKISQTILKNYFNDEGLINYIANQAFSYTQDVRDIEKIGKLCENKEDVDYIFSQLL